MLVNWSKSVTVTLHFFLIMCDLYLLFEQSGEVVWSSFITSGLRSCNRASGDNQASGLLLLFHSVFETQHFVFFSFLNLTEMILKDTPTDIKKMHVMS